MTVVSPTPGVAARRLPPAVWPARPLRTLREALLGSLRGNIAGASELKYRPVSTLRRAFFSVSIGQSVKPEGPDRIPFRVNGYVRASTVRETASSPFRGVSSIFFRRTSRRTLPVGFFGDTLETCGLSNTESSAPAGDARSVAYQRRLAISLFAWDHDLSRVSRALPGEIRPPSGEPDVLESGHVLDSPAGRRRHWLPLVFHEPTSENLVLITLVGPEPYIGFGASLLPKPHRAPCARLWTILLRTPLMPLRDPK